jgi:hypothetical protein
MWQVEDLLSTPRLVAWCVHKRRVLIYLTIPNARLSKGSLVTDLLTKPKYVTGLCQVGGHEGKPALSPGGALYKACTGKYEFRYTVIECFCWCHEMFAMMRAMSDPASSDPTPNTDAPITFVTRPPVDVSAPLAGPPPLDVAAERKHKLWKTLGDDINLAPQLMKLLRKLNLIDSPDTLYDGMIRQMIGDRRARGALEVNVEAVCLLWLDKHIPFEVLTPNEISLIIDAQEPPSIGAIYAVLTRWADAGLCITETNPMRFVKFTDKVTDAGVAEAKDRAARDANRRAKGFF